MRAETIATLGLSILAGAGCATTPAGVASSGKARAILAARDVPWERLPDGARRKVLFGEELTFVLLEAPGPTPGPIPLHSHPNEQITHVIDGDIDVRVGDEARRIAKGGFFRVAPNVPHGIRIRSPSVRLVDVFTPPREDFRPRPAEAEKASR